MTLFVGDIEGDSLKPTKIHVLSLGNPLTGKIHSTTNYDDMRRVFANEDNIFVIHNGILFDKPVLERILEIKIKCKFVDTLPLSWYLYPKRPRHGLESWGDTYGVPKPYVGDWENLDISVYIDRCEEDVKINMRLWNSCWKKLNKIYESEDAVWKFLDYITFKMECVRLQEKSRWKLDVPHVQKAVKDLSLIKNEKVEQLTEAMPPVPIIQVKSKPKRFLNKKGEYTKLGLDWIALLGSKNLPFDHEDDVEIITGYEPGNPNSTDQKKAWLYSLGWKPITFKHKKDKETGDEKKIPQINLEHGKGICKSIKRLYAKEPKLELLDGLSVLSHRIGILNGFLRDQEDGYVKASVQGLTNTLRFKHKEVVNLPKVEKLYAEVIRASLVCDEGTVLCGSDMSSLEDKIKQHFIFPLDPDYVAQMQQEDYDPHIIIAKMAGMMTEKEVIAYLAGDKSKKPIRDIAKNGNYACQYGAGAPRLMITCGVGMRAATALHSAYWELNWAVKKIAEMQIVKEIGEELWLYNPISEFWYSLRKRKDIFSTLVQGTAAYVFDMWLKNVLEKRPQLTGQFHDEFVLQIKKGAEEKAAELVQYAIDKLNEDVKLNVQLRVNTQYGKRYSEIH